MSETFTYDNLLAGDQRRLVNGPAIVDLGQVLSRGALLGRVLRVIGAAAADVGNTGEGTISNEALTAAAEPAPRPSSRSTPPTGPGSGTRPPRCPTATGSPS